MITSKEVFAKRKTGNIIEAYNMAVDLVNNTPYDEWNFKAYAYCLTDMIKQSVSAGDFNSAKYYAEILSSIDIDKKDEILYKSVQRAKDLSDPQKKIISDAKALSKQGKSQEAVNAYRVALSRFPNDLDIHTSLAWELYKIGKDLFYVEKIDVFLAKKLLAEYIKLRNKRPDRLHSLFLRLADKLIGNDGFNLVAFLKYWDLRNLTQEDYEPYRTDDGKIYPSIAEKVIQHAAKDALNKNIPLDIQYILPFLDKAIQKFQDNFWLIYYKAKLLHAIGRSNLAIDFSITVVKNKINDYWAWDLLGEILLNFDREKSFSCYCKALLCKTEDKFLINVRIKFAELLIEKSLFNEAKYEIEKAIQSREKEGWKPTDVLNNYQNSDWYKNSSATENNQILYKKNTNLAEALLFDKLIWLNAIVGEKFTTSKNPDKPKRKIFVSLSVSTAPLEISVSESKYNFKSLVVGQGLKVKGEYNHENKFQLYLINNREVAEKWDIFPEYIGVIDHVNNEKKIAHFIVNRTINGILHFSDFQLNFNIADAIAIRLSTYQSDREIRYSVLTCRLANQIPNPSVFKKFNAEVRVSNGLGFTNDDIFIDRPMIEKFGIENGSLVEGFAVQNFNKKKNVWGWKAIRISKGEFIQDYSNRVQK